MANKNDRYIYAELVNDVRERIRIFETFAPSDDSTPQEVFNSARQLLWCIEQTICLYLGVDEIEEANQKRDLDEYETIEDALWD